MKIENGYFIHWYNIDQENEHNYLNWLHNSYIPKRLMDKRIRWCCHYRSFNDVKHPGESGRLSHDKSSIPNGDRFILIFGADEPSVFVDPTIGEIHEQLSMNDKSMLSYRKGERYNIMTLESHGEGAVSKTKNTIGLADCIQLGNFNSGSYLDEDELSQWYVKWRIPSMKKLQGCLGVRKLISISGWAKHAILYEWSSAEHRNNNFLEHESYNPKMEAWTDRVVRKLVHAPGSPNLAEKIWPIDD